jgi:hypothetical protein
MCSSFSIERTRVATGSAGTNPIAKPEAGSERSSAAAGVVSTAPQGGVVAATGSAGTNPIAEPEAASDCSTGAELLCCRTRLATAFAAGVVEGMSLDEAPFQLSASASGSKEKLRACGTSRNAFYFLWCGLKWINAFEYRRFIDREHSSAVSKCVWLHNRFEAYPGTRSIADC